MAMVFLEGNINPTSRWLVIKVTCKRKDPIYSGELCSPPVNPSWLLKALDHFFSPPELCAAQHGPRFPTHVHGIHTTSAFCHFKLFRKPYKVPQLKLFLAAQGAAR